jgi:hypothetical protein
MISDIDNKRQNAQDVMDNVLMDWIELFVSDLDNQNSGAVDQLKIDILELRKIRWYSCQSDEFLKDIWQRFIDNEKIDKPLREAMNDFYLMGTGYILHRNNIPSGVYESFIKTLTHGITWVNRSFKIPDSLKEHTVGFEEFNSMVSNTPWLLFLILLSSLKLDINTI